MGQDQVELFERLQVVALGGDHHRLPERTPRSFTRELLHRAEHVAHHSWRDTGTEGRIDWQRGPLDVRGEELGHPRSAQATEQRLDLVAVAGALREMHRDRELPRVVRARQVDRSRRECRCLLRAPFFQPDRHLVEDGPLRLARRDLADAPNPAVEPSLCARPCRRR